MSHPNQTKLQLEEPSMKEVIDRGFEPITPLRNRYTLKHECTKRINALASVLLPKRSNSKYQDRD